MGSIAENLLRTQRNIPSGVELIVVSKFKPVEAIMEAYQAGQRVFGENKAQEMTTKQEQLPQDIQWHFIGHLQTNKVKYIVPYVTLIHSVDSEKLLEEINRLAKKNNRIVDCLLQFHIAKEDTKFGFSLQEAKNMLDSDSFKDYCHIRLCGVMGMATFTDNEMQIRSEFRTLKEYFIQLKETYFPQADYFKEISMGMTDDYRIAIEENSTMVRIGSAIFGNRTI